jgi:hypothetical protein
MPYDPENDEAYDDLLALDPNDPDNYDEDDEWNDEGDDISDDDGVETDEDDDFVYDEDDDGYPPVVEEDEEEDL